MTDPCWLLLISLFSVMSLQMGFCSHIFSFTEVKLIGPIIPFFFFFQTKAIHLSFQFFLIRVLHNFSALMAVRTNGSKMASLNVLRWGTANWKAFSLDKYFPLPNAVMVFLSIILVLSPLTFFGEGWCKKCLAFLTLSLVYTLLRGPLHWVVDQLFFFIFHSLRKYRLNDYCVACCQKNRYQHPWSWGPSCSTCAQKCSWMMNLVQIKYLLLWQDFLVKSNGAFQWSHRVMFSLKFFFVPFPP